MADKDKKDKGEKGAEAAPAEAAPKKKGLPLKIIIVVAALMLVEGVGVFFVLGALGGPKASKADADPKHLAHDDSEETQEMRVLEKEDEKYQNLSSGQVWVWNVSIVVQVKNKNAERVDHVLDSRRAEIKEGLSQVISRAQIAQLKEPERQSLNRQVSALLEKIIGQDADGKPLIERVLIPTCSGYPASY
jgi:flagellar basal body-associated protein FliL